MQRRAGTLIQAGGNLDPSGGTLIQAGPPGAGDSKTTVSRHEGEGDLCPEQRVGRATFLHGTTVGRRWWRGKCGSGGGREIIEFPLHSLSFSTIPVIFGDPPFPFGNPFLLPLLWILVLRGLVMRGGWSEGHGRGKGFGAEGRHLMVPELSSGGPFSR